MRSLTDEELIKAYYQAKKLGLDPNFIQQLESALKRRRIFMYKGRPK
ncbi:sporulation histidine kinase inhibitor Sda [Sporosarcina pasteurii]|nr:sporulation histidine kinase inhibitor Sda [Sporosarcina pasteurii]MDS9473235.1 sporulation histidine kinase inhibitor Sda [Sporosarcina pasteurii]QBQ06965.1 sporulation histidine kinase inhibitor Sda [Sporosarcina pasteurii]